jgi:hypothetical protein
MRHLIAVVLFGVGTVLAAVALSPTPDAITVLYYIACMLGLTILAYCLGRYSVRNTVDKEPGA